MPWKTVPICDQCWNLQNDHEPVRLQHTETEKCYKCGQNTSSGIYIRAEIEHGSRRSP
jgi:hypothetical protein